MSKIYFKAAPKAYSVNEDAYVLVQLKDVPKELSEDLRIPLQALSVQPLQLRGNKISHQRTLYVIKDLRLPDGRLSKASKARVRNLSELAPFFRLHTKTYDLPKKRYQLQRIDHFLTTLSLLTCKQLEQKPSLLDAEV